MPQILLVEDDETDALFVQRCLNKQGASIPLTLARDGSEALEILRGEDGLKKPFIILTDLNMPGMSGHELIQEIRTDGDLRDSVIFVLSSSRLNEDIERCYAMNVAGYLTKDSDPVQLGRRISMLLDYCDAVHLPS